MSKKVCGITGTTIGIGSVVTASLAKRKDTIVMLNRDSRASEQLQRDLEVYAVSKDIHAIPCKLESWASVAEATDRVMAEFGRVDLLVNTAQSLYPSPRATPGGIELTLRANFLAHAQLSMRFLETIRANHGRVVNVVGGPFPAKNIVPQDSERASPTGHPALNLNRSRLLVFTLELARRLGPDASAVAVNPGPINSDPTEGMPIFSRLSARMRALPPHAAAIPLMKAATGEIGASGELLGIRGVEAIPEELADPELGRRLWDWCESLLAAEAAAPPVVSAK